MAVLFPKMGQTKTATASGPQSPEEIRHGRQRPEAWFVVDVDQISGSVHIASIGDVLDIDAINEMASV